MGTPVATLLGFSPGAVTMPALPRTEPAAPAPLPQGRAVTALAVLGMPDPLAPGMKIVLFPGVGGRGTVGVTGVVMVPGASGIVGRAAPTGGMTIGPGIEPAAALAANERTSKMLSNAINGLSMKRPFVTADFLPVRPQDDNAL